MRRKSIVVSISVIFLVLALFGCNGQRDNNTAFNENLSVSKYNDITEKYFEETSDGYKAALYDLEEIAVEIEVVKNWIDTCEPCGQYYSYIHSDSDSWDMYIYYPANGSSDRVYDSFKFCVVDQVVKVYVKSSKTTEDQSSQYVLIRIQAPHRGAWPYTSNLFIDDEQIELSDTSSDTTT